ncbi:Hypp8931 [Branchiostoma lanceolatum]|uniref:Hypp8931 protein n=1 Tax=Branchiostoma lanceolatum TaxID=7740 RepID=A0A8K0EH78_BRALA|nr:Hypp8931 [Branchiostoma lanceolatum]
MTSREQRDSVQNGFGSGTRKASVVPMDTLGEDEEDSGEDEQEAAEERARQLEEQNKFDALCDGILSAVALLSSSLQEVIDLKDELLEHSLPPNVLVRLAIVSGKIFRSATDLNVPVTELVRLVRVYSEPWDEKSEALKKLHADYESKKRQLNIAIKRLQLVDAHSKRLAREKRIMNWEKLFAKLTSSKGHGRRWKFLIDSFKKKAQMGAEHLLAYASSVEDEYESDDDFTQPDHPQFAVVSPSTEGPEKATSPSDFESEPEPESEPESGSENDLPRADSELESETGSEHEGKRAASSSSKHSTTSHEGGTLSDGSGDNTDGSSDSDSESDSDSDTEGKSKKKSAKKGQMKKKNAPIKGVLKKKGAVKKRRGSRVRFGGASTVGAPELVVKPPSEDRAVWTHEPEYDRFLNVRVYKPVGMQDTELTCVLTMGDQVFKTGVLDAPSPPPAEPKPETPEKPKKGSLIGKGGVKRRKSVTVKEPHEETPKEDDRFEEFVFSVPDKLAEMQGLKVAVNSQDEMAAMATIEAEDLTSLELPVKSLPDENAEFDANLKSTDPTMFPLYATKSSKHGIYGNLPLKLYWTQQERPRTFERDTETVTLMELIKELTGVDLSQHPKEEIVAMLEREYEDRATSAMSFEEEKEDMVPKAELESLMEQHNAQLMQIQDEYEKRLNELAENLEEMQERAPPPLANMEHAMVQYSPQGTPVHPRSPVSRAQTRDITRSPNIPQVPQTSRESSAQAPKPPPATAYDGMYQPQPPPHTAPRAKRKTIQAPQPNAKLPKDFLERLKFQTAESIRRQAELYDKTRRMVEEKYLRQMEGQHRMTNPEPLEQQLEDVCLPAVFMPTKTGHIYNPRAYQYFHPNGLSGDIARLTQPPSVFQLPPLANRHRLSVMNLFDLSQNFQSKGSDWLSNIPAYRSTSQTPFPMTPAPTVEGPSQPHSASTLMRSHPMPHTH